MTANLIEGRRLYKTSCDLGEVSGCAAWGNMAYTGTGGPKDADMLLEAEIVRGELAGLELLHFVELEREVIEGSYHTGRASVLQVVARKP